MDDLVRVAGELVWPVITSIGGGLAWLQASTQELPPGRIEILKNMRLAIGTRGVGAGMGWTYLEWPETCNVWILENERADSQRSIYCTCTWASSMMIS